MTRYPTHARSGILGASLISYLMITASFSAHALVNGQTVEIEDQERLGLISLGNCSGALLTTRVVVTAKHCVKPEKDPDYYIKDPNKLIVNAKWGTGFDLKTCEEAFKEQTKEANEGGYDLGWDCTSIASTELGRDSKPQTRKALNIYIADYDLAVITLDVPFVVNGSWRGFRQEIWGGPKFRNLDLNQRSVDVFGMGPYEFANEKTGSTSHFDGNYRIGKAVISEVNSKSYQLNMLYKRQIGGGDSGGPSFLTNCSSCPANGPILTGVHANCSGWSLVPGKEFDLHWTWVTASGGCKDSPLDIVWEKIQEIILESTRIPIAAAEPVPSTFTPDSLLRRKRPPIIPGTVPTPSVTSDSPLRRNRPLNVPGKVPTPSVTPDSQTCKSPYVWRVARPDDLVCVTVESRERVANENITAAERSLPGGACQPGFVWREAFPGDGVCVKPKIRDLVRKENLDGPSRRMEPGAVLGPATNSPSRRNRDIFR